LHGAGVIQPAHRFEIVVAAAVGRQQAVGEEAGVFRYVLHKPGVVMTRRQVPQAQGGLRHAELGAQAIDQRARQVGAVARLQQRLVPAVEFLRNRLVFLRQARQVAQLQLQRLVLVAHDFHLALLQRDGLAGQRTRQLDLAQQGRVLDEKLRIVDQKVGDGGGIQGVSH
jgi:hypothetical protein